MSVTGHLPFRSDRLREELVNAAGRQIRRRRRRSRALRILVITTVVSVSVVASQQFLQSEPSSANVLDIKRDREGFVVSLVNLNAKPKEVATELRNAGMHVNVKTVPVANPMKGLFIGLSTGSSGIRDPGDRIDPTFRSFRINSANNVKVELKIGRVAHKGEHYAVPYRAYAPGGPFHCAQIMNHRVGDVLTKVNQAAKKVSWQKYSPGSGVTPTTPLASINQYVVDALMQSADAMLVYVSDVQESPYAIATNGIINDCGQ